MLETSPWLHTLHAAFVWNYHFHTQKPRKNAFFSSCDTYSVIYLTAALVASNVFRHTLACVRDHKQ